MSAAQSTAAQNAQDPLDADVPALPRLLADIPEEGPMSLREHLELRGELPRFERRRREEGPLIATIERAGLTGRGGAGFPTAAKMRAVAHARGRAIVVVNIAEGEPASMKDRTLAQALPHVVLDGAELAAEAVGADEVIVCVCESASASVGGVAAALEERAARSRSRPRAQLVTVPATYVAGQESALVNFLDGGPAFPTFAPPRPFEAGVRRRPTLVSNAETLAHLALIARHGSAWFRELGTPSEPGSALVTLSGPVTRPGVYEIECGASLRSLIEAAGGTTARIRGALIGGYAGTWIAGELVGGIALSREHLAPHGATLGAGVVLLLSEHACPVAETARAARWLAEESSRQCGPCVHGLDAIASTIEQIAVGETGQRRVLADLGSVASLVRRRGACGHPDGAVGFVLSAVEAFASDFTDHARHGRCDACLPPGELPLPEHVRVYRAGEREDLGVRRLARPRR
ncbi:MAG TPA: NADH-ubiquinone oxidoreductase-F iron-sulfur binding region domain-containing protein [Solirubrobacteraceae bacterium]|nr:NADH-ubiquinone oxidoreductase-F iron-sulfur binding region domain-containing protein [Solirubrobacteraceae bacterium]